MIGFESFEEAADRRVDEFVDVDAMVDDHKKNRREKLMPNGEKTGITMRKKIDWREFRSLEA